MPNSTISAMLSPSEFNIVYLVAKRSLGASWGDFGINWKVIHKKAQETNNRNAYNSPEQDAYHYESGDEEFYDNDYDPKPDDKVDNAIEETQMEPKDYQNME